MHITPVRTLAVVCLSAGALALAGCGSSGSSAASSAASAAGSAIASAGQSAASSVASAASSAASDMASAASSAAASMLPPVIVESNATTATAKVGDSIVFSVDQPTATKISTKDTDIVELTQGYTDGSATYNPGAKALKAGTAVVTVSSSVGDRDVTITVTE